MESRITSISTHFREPVRGLANSATDLREKNLDPRCIFEQVTLFLIRWAGGETAPHPHFNPVLLVVMTYPSILIFRHHGQNIHSKIDIIPSFRSFALFLNWFLDIVERTGVEPYFNKLKWFISKLTRLPAKYYYLSQNKHCLTVKELYSVEI